jgi:hypothetical protein
MTDKEKLRQTEYVSKNGAATPLRKNVMQLDPIENSNGELGSHLKSQIGTDIRTWSRAQLASNSTSYNGGDLLSQKMNVIAGGTAQ